MKYIGYDQTIVDVLLVDVEDSETVWKDIVSTEVVCLPKNIKMPKGWLVGGTYGQYTRENPSAHR